MPQLAGSPADPPAAGRFAHLDGLVRAAVESAARVDPNPADPYRGLYVSDDLALALAHQTVLAESDPRLADAAARIGLDDLGAAVLGLCAAPELSPHYGRLYGYLHDDVTRKLASPRLVVRLLGEGGVDPEPVWQSFAGSSPLRCTGAIALLEPRSAVPLADRAAKVSDRLVAHLIGARLDEPVGDGRIRLVIPPAHDLGRPGTVAELRSLLADQSALPVVVCGPDAVELVAVAAQCPVLVVDVNDAGERELMAEARLRAALEGALVCYAGLDDAAPADVRRRLRQLRGGDGRLIVCAATRADVAALGDGTAFVIEVPAPSFAERRAAWSSLAGTDDVADVAAKFRLPISKIADATEVAAAAARAAGGAVPTPADLDRGARHASATGLAELAVYLEPAFAWGDLVLPDRQLDVLRSVSAFLRHRDLVLSEWGYDRTVARTQGLNVLFAGESGTGKTMAAQVLAHDLGLDLYRIDLASTVSKYIGETEKNLDRIFAAAEGSNAILFFDEADALFGKRSEVRDSHDRYANIEVAYLLQRMDSYPGAVILATNFRQNMDDAFLRRLDFVVDFPFPEAGDRERIWRLVLPAQAPVADDVDTGFLANQFKLAGGNIRNASLAAAFAAAEERSPIGMRHLILAVALEYTKLGRLTLESDFERFHDVIRGN
jgi:ATPase family associated with various cellular activities (AAA)